MTEPKLVLGTANLCNAYGRNNPGKIDWEDSLRLLRRAYDEGIRWIDVSPNYNNLDLIKEWQEDIEPFNIVGKVAKWEDIDTIESLAGMNEYFVLGHGLKAYEENKTNLDGASLYNPDEIGQDMGVIEFPINVFDMRWIADVACLWDSCDWIARSIFLQGDLFIWNWLAEISFNLAMSLPIEYVIVGANTPDQLSEIVHMPRYEVDYAELAKGGTWLKKTLR